MPSQYKLVNPYIDGKFNSKFTGKSETEVAEKAWNSMSKYFASNVPRFAFTMERLSDGKLCHFKVEEDKNDDEDVSYQISQMNLKHSKKQNEQLRNKLQTVRKQHGGADDDDDDDDSPYRIDRMEKLYSKLRYNTMSNSFLASPMIYWWYNPLVYDLESFYVPVFVPQVHPYMEVWTSTNFWGI